MNIQSKDLVCVIFNYNNGNYLELCLESILKQDTIFSYDIIIMESNMSVINSIDSNPNHETHHLICFN